MEQIIRKYYPYVIVTLILVSTPIISRSLIYTGQNKENETLSSKDSLLVFNALTKEISALDRKISAKTPKTYYLVINSTANEFSLFKGDALIKKDMCSTGSYMLLKKRRPTTMDVQDAQRRVQDTI